MRYKVCLIIVAAVLSIGLIGCGQITKDLTDDSAKNTTGGVNQDQETVISERTVNISTSMVRAGTIKPQCVTGPDSITLAEGKSELLSFLVDCQDTTTPGLIRIELRGYLDEDGLVGQDNPTSILPVKVDCSNGTIELNKNTVVLQTWTAPFAANSLSTTVDMNVSGDWTNAGNQAYSGKLHLKLVKVFNEIPQEYNWAEVDSSFATPNRAYYTTAVFNDKLWIIGGTTTSGIPQPGDLLNDVWYSDDGKSWHCATASANFSPRTSGTCVSVKNKLWLFGGAGDYPGESIYNGDVWYSENGINWIKALDKLPGNDASNFEVKVFSYINKLWLIYPYKNCIYSSEDGTSWTKINLTCFADDERVQTIVEYNNKIYMCTRYSNGDMLNIWSSGDGFNWQKLKTFSRMQDKYFFDDFQVYKGHLLIFESYFNSGEDCGNRIWESTDGMTWKAKQLSNNGPYLLAGAISSYYTRELINFRDSLYLFTGDDRSATISLWYLDSSM